ncbi:extracellular solute-binding protein [Actinomadura macrotermitis]|uniref:Extracellular solute-binding protein n=1 Tax=Actinomadura macrotermitis TaxID=2585200 RepID=A0A7K0C8L1_9ACTN|nr:extracellular solute-binding protein [Actinomadura macrotermitis]MQY09432.1 hypothetical protein [Actinomadura macrotermitis]
MAVRWYRGRTSWFCFAASALAVLLVALWMRFQSHADYSAMAADCHRDDLVVAGGDDVSLNNQRRALIKQWNTTRDARGRPHPHATMVEVSPSTDLQHSQLKAVLESGGCGYDVLIMDNIWTAQFADAGYLRPLTGLGDLADFFPAALRTGERHGVRYAVPFNLDVGLLYYRDGVTPPPTWGALLAGGFVTHLAGEGLTVNALETVWNEGGTDLLTGDREPSEQELRRVVHPALQRLAEQVRGPLRDARQRDEQAAIEAFAGGAQLMRNWPYAYSALATEPRMRGGDRLLFAAAAPPGRTVLGGQNLAVAARSPNPGPARDLIAFLTGTDAQRMLFSCGGFAPARYSALGLSPARHAPGDVTARTCAQLTGQTPARGDGDLPRQDQLTEFGQTLVRALAQAQPRPETPYYTTFTATFRDCVRKMLDGPGPDAATFAKAVRSSLDGRTASC